MPHFFKKILRECGCQHRLLAYSRRKIPAEQVPDVHNAFSIVCAFTDNWLWHDEAVRTAIDDLWAAGVSFEGILRSLVEMNLKKPLKGVLVKYLMRKKIAGLNERVKELEEEVARLTHAREVPPAAVALPEEEPAPAEMNTPEGLEERAASREKQNLLVTPKQTASIFFSRTW